MIATNAAFMRSQEERVIAESGMKNVVEVPVLPGMEIYRFGSATKPTHWYSGSWWFGKSVHDALLQYARWQKVSLSQAARVCLAVPLEWSSMDVLLSARVTQPLAAWSGTPKTVRPDESSAAGRRLEGRHGFRHEPDRQMTQLYIPGLHPTKTTATCVPWREVFGTTWHIFLPAA